MNAPPTANDTCANERCECVVSGMKTVDRDGRTFCSEGCANGGGCEHEKCHCVEKN